MKYLLILLTASLLPISCTNIPYKKSKAVYKNKDYYLAIEKFDNYIKNGSNPALKVPSKLYRSNSYYFLGKNQMEEKNYKIAAKLLFLSNSDKADSLLDDCYFHISNSLIKKTEYKIAMDYLNFIIVNLEKSNFLPEVLFTKLKIEYEIEGSPEKSYETYKMLVGKFPDNEEIISAKKIVDQYMPFFMEQTKAIWKQENYNIAIEKLLHYIPIQLTLQMK